jgi:hypothetical protein
MKHPRITLVGYFFLLTFLFTACNQASEKEVSFVFVGDVHYKIPEYHAAKHWVPQLAKELDALVVNPEFVIQTGDFFHGNRGTDI